MKLQELMHRLHEEYIKHGDMDVVFNWTAQIRVEERGELRLNGQVVPPVNTYQPPAQVVLTHFSTALSGLDVTPESQIATFRFYSYS